MGDLKLGAKLPSESELAQQFGVNRSTVREGIRELEHEGLVRREGRRRLSVSLPSTAYLAPRASRALVMHQVTFKELWEVALVLEPASASLCAQNRTEAERVAIANNLERTRKSLSDGRHSAELDTQYHSLIAAGTHNKALLPSREPIGLLLYPAFEILIPHLPQAIVRMQKAHEQVADAIARRDAADAEQWMRKHIVDFRRGWELAKLSLDAPVNLPPAIAEA
jgi:DNA-binding FadR family transcriptional regulator